jgi:uncharacterized protein (DUF1015 family)
MEPGGVVPPPFVAGPLRLAPFRALRLPPTRVGDPGTLRQLNRSARAGDPSWREQAGVTQDGEPALYVHEYSDAGLTVRGLVGALDVSRRARAAAERAVFPHEGIRPVQADDLADRMAELAMNPAPILLVHRADAAVRAIVDEVVTATPDHELTDRQDQHHRIWAIRTPAVIEALNAGLLTTRAMIADGHHRYAAYLRLQVREPGTAADLGLAMLVDQVSTPLFLGPIHRTLSGASLEDLATATRAVGGTWLPMPREQALERLGPWTLAVTDGTSWAALGLPADQEDKIAVEVLHDEVLPAMPRGPQGVHYAHSVDQALRAVRRSHRLALVMPAPDVDQVLRIVAAGRLLPEKATSFQPKPSGGVLFRSLRDG